jgi:hypothetical protein
MSTPTTLSPIFAAGCPMKVSLVIVRHIAWGSKPQANRQF